MLPKTYDIPVELTWTKEELEEKIAEVDCNRCGRCCHHPVVLLEELEKIKEFLKEHKDEFPEHPDYYFEKDIFGDLKDVESYRTKYTDSKCIFFGLEKGEAECDIHEVKPIRCSSYICTERAGRNFSLGTDVWFYYNHFIDNKNPEHLEWLKKSIIIEEIKVTKNGKPFLL